MSKFKDMKLRYKIVAGIATGGLILGGAGAAFAYFTNNGGTATGTGTVGSSQAWTVTDGGMSTGPLYPGAGSETDTVSVANANSGNQELSTITATLNTPASCVSGDFSLAPSTGWVIASGSQSATYAVNEDVRGTGSTSGVAGPVTSSALTLIMNDTNANQNSCAGSSPTITWTVG